MTPRKFTFVTFGCVAFLLALLYGFLRYMDPLYYYGARDRAWANAVRYSAVDYPEMSKIYALGWFRPQTLILGTSRAQIGLDPTHRKFAHQPVYNLGYPGSNMPQTLALFQHAVATQRIKQVVLGADFFAFRVSHGGARNLNLPQFDRLNVRLDGRPTPLLRHLRALAEDFWFATFSATAVRLSLQDWLTNSRRFDLRNMRWVMKRNGHNVLRNLQPQPLPYEGIFSSFEAAYMRDLTQGQFCLRAETGYSQLDDFRLLVQTARERNIDLRILVSPAHASLWEVLDKAGLWDSWETWKRELVRIGAEESQPGWSVRVFDFSGYTEITIDPVPINAPEMQMTNYWDPSHYKKETGDRILDIVLADEPPTKGPIGGLITPSNIEHHLAAVRDARALWRARAPEQARRIKDPPPGTPAKRC